ncbi:MAG: endonuclease I family protein [Oligoflexales bacterium]
MRNATKSMVAIIFFFSMACKSRQEGSAVANDQHNCPDENNYYEGADDASDLRAFLGERLAQCYNRIGYDQVWDALRTTDADKNNPGQVIQLYSGIPTASDTDESSFVRSHTGAQSNASAWEKKVWNREHVWAKSRGFPKPGFYAYTDLHHLRVANKKLNADRHHYEFGDGPSLRTYPDSSLCETCRIDVKGQLFYPGDLHKGDVARMLLYMDVRYDGIGDGVDPSRPTPDLQVVDELQYEDHPQGPPGSPRSDEYAPKFGNLCTLLRWHAEDPVDDIERERNNAIYGIQHNRNPFIDHPEYADRIWANACH